MKARIEELVMLTGSVNLDPLDRISIKEALTTLANECYERAARECEEPEPECCDRPDRHHESGEIIGCCGSPDPRPRSYDECAAAIRSLLTEET